MKYETPLEITKRFIKEDFINRNLLGAIDCLSRDISWFGTGENEEVSNIVEAENYISKEIHADSEPYEVEYISQKEQLVCEGIGNANIKVKFTAKEISIICRITSFTCIEDHEVKINSMHFSVPDRLQDEKEFFPFSMEERYARELTLEYFNNTVSCGIIGEYFEKNYPFYFINDKMLNVLGYSHREEYINAVEGLNINGIFVNDRERVEREVSQQIHRNGEYKTTYRMIKKSGDYIWVDDCGRLIKTNDNRDAIISACIDVTEKHTKSLQVNSDRAMMIRAIEVLFPKCISINLSKNTYTTVENNKKNKINYSDNGSYSRFIQEELEEIHLEDRKKYKETFSRENLILQYEKKEKIVSLNYRTMDDDRMWHWDNSIVIFTVNMYSDDILAIALTECIDEQKAIEEYLRDREKKLASALDSAKRANDAKSEFMSRMSHDIRTPMNAIIGMTNIALESDELTKEVKECLETIDLSSNFLLGLVNDILDMSKIDQGEVILNPTPYELGEFKKYLVTMIGPLCNDKKIVFTINEINIKYDCIMVDKVRFNQICFNILSNSVKYTPEGGKICLTIKHIEKKGKNLKIQIVVKDNGIGMSEEFQKKMFEPFTQEDTHHVNEVQGTGLGLSIVKSIVDIMGGTIEVKSKVGEGTEFIINLVIEEGTKYKGIENKKILSTKCLEGKKLLVCEDHPINLEIVRRLLEKAKVHVEAAEDGKKGYDKFIKSPKGYYDGILMDIRMPNLDGLQATKNIRMSNHPDALTIPIISMTANAFDSDIQESKESGMNGHISKPINPNILYSTLIDLT